MTCDHFINSKDLRSYLRQIDYSFTTPEAAFLVWYCRNATLKEKFAAWQEIIETMPDCSLTRRKSEPIGNCHDFLRRHIASQETLLREFPDGKDCVYRYETYEPQRPNLLQDEGWVEIEEYFNSFESCLSHGMRHLDEDSEISKIRFYRHERCGKDGKDTIRWVLETDREKNPVFVDRWGICNDELAETDGTFSDMWFDFPTPFKRGDLVWAPSRTQAAPFVLNHLNVWDSGEMIRQGFSPDIAFVRNADRRVQRYRKTGCVADMGAYGYGWREGFGIYNEFGGWATYLDLEFYPFELEGRDRALRPVSEFLKGNCDLELLLNSYAALLLETKYGEIAKAYQKEYIKEALEMVGLETKPER